MIESTTMYMSKALQWTLKCLKKDKNTSNYEDAIVKILPKKYKEIYYRGKKGK